MTAALALDGDAFEVEKVKEMCGERIQSKRKQKANKKGERCWTSDEGRVLD